MTNVIDSGRGADPLVSIVLPVFNEAPVLERLVAEIQASLDAQAVRHEIVFVNDGSTDASEALLDELARRDGRIRVVHFSRNFGHQAALQAGLIHASGDAVIVMDADMQDDPRAFGPFLDHWRAGYDVVYAIRTKRKEHALKRFLFYSFYRVLNAISRTPIPKDAGNFGLLDRKVVQQIVSLTDRDRYFPGLRRWVGFRQIGVEVERQPRYDGTPKVTLRGLWRLAQTAIFSFSTVPLTVFYLIALAALLVLLGLTAFTLYHRLITGLAIPGWTSMLMVASFFGALNALGIAILGEYVVRIYDEVRSRPVYIVGRRVNCAEPPTLSATAAASTPEASQMRPDTAAR